MQRARHESGEELEKIKDKLHEVFFTSCVQPVMSRGNEGDLVVTMIMMVLVMALEMLILPIVNELYCYSNDYLFNII